MSEKVIIEAVIREHRLSGMIADLHGGGEAWIPHDELSYEPDFDPDDIRALRERWPIGMAVRVTPLGHAASHRHTAVVSVAAAAHDPWDNQVPDWVRERAIKTMVVADISQPDCLYGEIARGVRACLTREDFRAAIGEQAAQDNFFLPLPGDRIAGRVTGSDTATRLVHLSASLLFRGRCAAAAGVTPSDDNLLRNPDLAIRVLADDPHLALRKHQDAGVSDAAVRDGASIVPRIEHRHIFILDNEPDVLETLVGFLRAYGCQVDGRNTVASAREFFAFGQRSETSTNLADAPHAGATNPVTLALLDIDLTGDPEGGPVGGIQFAHILHRERPTCRIILISGEPMTDQAAQRYAQAASGLPICAFLEKPVPPDTLLSAIGRAVTSAPRDAGDLFRGFVRADSRPNRTRHHAHAVERIENDRQEATQRIVCRLRQELRADSVFLFSMHPVTYETAIVAQDGIPMGNLPAFLPKLRYSPVADICFAHGNEATGRYDEDAQSDMDFGRHRYLLYCYSPREHRRDGYRSCVATQVMGGHGDPLAYALFAMSRRPRDFPATSALLITRLAASEIGTINLDYRARRATEDDFAFLMAGRAASSLGHDLSNQFQHAININTALASIEPVLAGDTSSARIVAVREALERARKGLGFAHAIAESFRTLARSQNEPEAVFPIGDLFDPKRGAVALAGPELNAAAVEVSEFDQADTECFALRIRARRNALLRVLQNILNNSAQQRVLRGVLSGRVKIRIRKATQPADGGHGDCVQVDMLDTGPGIHWRDREQVFEPRFTTRPVGSGMGLHIAREEVRRARGTIEVRESVLGFGTWLRIVLPVIA